MIEVPLSSHSGNSSAGHQAVPCPGPTVIPVPICPVAAYVRQLDDAMQANGLVRMAFPSHGDIIYVPSDTVLRTFSFPHCPEGRFQLHFRTNRLYGGVSLGIAQMWPLPVEVPKLFLFVTREHATDYALWLLHLLRDMLRHGPSAITPPPYPLLPAPGAATSAGSEFAGILWETDFLNCRTPRAERGPGF